MLCGIGLKSQVGISKLSFSPCEPHQEHKDQNGYRLITLDGRFEYKKEKNLQ